MPHIVLLTTGRPARKLRLRHQSLRMLRAVRLMLRQHSTALVMSRLRMDGSPRCKSKLQMMAKPPSSLRERACVERLPMGQLLHSKRSNRRRGNHSYMLRQERRITTRPPRSPRESVLEHLCDLIQMGTKTRLPETTRDDAKISTTVVYRTRQTSKAAFSPMTSRPC